MLVPIAASFSDNCSYVIPRRAISPRSDPEAASVTRTDFRAPDDSSTQRYAAQRQDREVASRTGDAMENHIK
jgi:hypothetical protein